MAKMTTYVPDELKKRMDKVKKEDVNWSALACRAFEEKLAEISAKKVEKNMQDVIERLKKAARDDETADTAEGRKAGEWWAKNKATPKQLERITELDNSETPGRFGRIFDDVNRGWYGLATRAILGLTDAEWSGFERRDIEDFWENAIGDDAEKAKDSDFLFGFLDGASDVWAEVCDKV